ncbi:MAG: glycoside hydrolase family 2 TIM barrel-domain containing protein [Bacteroidales bacterium]
MQVPNNQLWSGLKQKQTIFPHSNAPKPHPILKEFQNIPFGLKNCYLNIKVDANNRENHPNDFILDKGWVLTPMSNTKGKLIDIKNSTYRTYNATVPGTVLQTLVDQGVFPDPFYGLNNMYIPDSLANMSWTYNITFKGNQLPKSVLNAPRNYLIFNGINYRADIYIDDNLLGHINGAFIRGKFDISFLIAKCKNEPFNYHTLKVNIHPLDHPGIPHEQSIKEGQGLNGGQPSLDAATFISSIGWDWMPGIRDRNIGIWQDVRIRPIGNIEIGDAFIITDLPLPDTTSADLSIQIPITNLTNRTLTDSLNIIITEIKTLKGFNSQNASKIFISKKISVKAHETKYIIFDPVTYPSLHIKNPKLWWPNGSGQPNLYTAKIFINEDFLNLRFGIREYEYIMTTAKKNRKGQNTDNIFVRTKIDPTSHIQNFKSHPLLDNKHKVLYDNASNIYVSMQMPDLLEKKSSSASKKPSNIIDKCAPFLVIKINGKRIFCRGGNWGMDNAMKRCSYKDLEDYFLLHRDMNLNIIRNWTGESTQKSFYDLCDEYGMMVWNDFWITTDDTVEPLDNDLFMDNATDVVLRYRNHPCIAIYCPRNEGFAPEFIEESLSQMLAKYDPTRLYHGQSRFLNMGTSGPWGYIAKTDYYFSERASGFNTEMGSFAIPTASTIKKFIAMEDLWPIRDVWAYHDMHYSTQNFEAFIRAVNQYGQPKNYVEFANKSQFVCYNSWRAMMEAWNSKMWNNTTGLILWMSHPAWPSMIWQTYTYDKETPGSYFGLKKACEPIHIQYNPSTHMVELISSKKGRFIATAEIYKKKLIKSYSKKISIKANSKKNCFIVKENLDGKLLRLKLTSILPKDISINDYDYRKNRFTDLSSLTQQLKKTVKKNEFIILISNPSNQIVSDIKIRAFNQDGKQYLPILVSDSYFNLLPDESRKIRLTIPNMHNTLPIIKLGH